MNLAIDESRCYSREEAPAAQSVPNEQHKESIAGGILAGLPPMLTTEQTAAALQVSENKVRHMFRTKALPGCKVAQTWRCPRKWLEEFLEGGGTHE